jgi:hypothetical protein
MAGAGYKLFNTGDVLTAAQVNTYLMEQTVMVFADAAARTTALTGVVSEGMISYLKDTNAVEVYNGSAWVASDDPNAIQNTIVDAKGDLITATAADTPARLAVGSNGDTLVADSAATTGLRWQGNYAAGKNKIINGAFDVWQRGTSFTTTGAYTADRFYVSAGTAAVTASRQTFTAGTAPVAGYEGQYFHRIACAATTSYVDLSQKIEDVRTFAGQTVTFSFWAKADSNVTWTVFARQDFGSGGSALVDTGFSATASLTTSWQRFSMQVTLPSVSGKTIGTSSYLQIIGYINGAAANSRTVDFWGLQLEAGNVATAFQTATGTLQGELAACEYYFQKCVRTNGVALGQCLGTSATEAQIQLKGTMRTAPTITLAAAGSGSGQLSFLNSTGNFASTIGSNAAIYITTDGFSIAGTGYTSSFTAGNSSILWIVGANHTAYTASAEL